MIGNDNLISKFTELLASQAKPLTYLTGDAQGSVPRNGASHACVPVRL